ncbi:PH domain-containing protein [Alteromonas sp. ASW11-36]|uniref:PH domain-containing protein n=1 Tax=Alteromonas arenosi TaxID=3055817 RepID=A0ABT7SUG6_9ALTE|nr:PH domain-containing protein [Alteromonas sp. ASW11-36]MDM7859840.1 PH domain-containing protein [Alteromonas sp. ASW11-36]
MMNSSDLQQPMGSWQRVHPVALIYFAVQFLKGLVSQLFVLVPIFIGLRSALDSNPAAIIGIMIGASVLMIAYAIAAFLAFQFRVNQDSVEIHKGVFKRLKLNLPFDKIQDVKLEQPIYYRWHNTRVVMLDTAGSAKQEAIIVALPEGTTNALRDQIQQQKNQQQTSTVPSSDSQLEDNEQGEVLNRRSIGDLIIHGITNNRVWIILGAFSPFIDDAIRYLDNYLADSDLIAMYSIEQQGLVLYLTFVLSTVLLIFLFITLLSVVGAIITFYDYRLVKLEGRLRRLSGLLTKYQVSINISRIQHVEYNQDWLDGLFGRINLVYKQISHTSQRAVNDQSSLMVPSVTAQQSVLLGQAAFSHNNPFEQSYQRISKRFIIKYSALLTLPFTVAIVTVVFLSDVSAMQYLWLFAPVVLQGLIVLRWFRWGVYHDQTHLYVRKGFFGVDRLVCPLCKLQQSDYAQSLFQRRVGLANIKLGLASSVMTVPMIKQTTALNIINRALYNTEFSQQNWM